MQTVQPCAAREKRLWIAVLGFNPQSFRHLSCVVLVSDVGSRFAVGCHFANLFSKIAESLILKGMGSGST